ncbi:MAG: hypothetical protein ACTHKV_08480, partial [Flavipsychrobacter sp.]
KHLDVLDAADNRAFCRFQDNTQFDAIRNNASRNIVVIMSFFGRASGDVEDPAVMNTIVVRFSCYAKTVNSAEITTALEKAFSIMQDFWTRMMNDYREDSCLWLNQADWTNIQFEEIEQPWLQNHFGWDLVLPYKTYLPAYNPEKWNDGD